MVLSGLTESIRFAFYRYLVDCDPAPDARLQLKIAEVQQELEDFFDCCTTPMRAEVS